MSDADRALQMRAALVAEFARADVGQPVTVIQQTAGTYQPGTQAVGITPTNKTGRGRVGSYRDKDIDGSRILQGDRRITWLPDGWTFVPVAGMQVSFGSETLAIVSVIKRELGGTPICYTLQVR